MYIRFPRPRIQCILSMLSAAGICCAISAGWHVLYIIALCRPIISIPWGLLSPMKSSLYELPLSLLNMQWCAMMECPLCPLCPLCPCRLITVMVHVIPQNFKLRIWQVLAALSKQHGHFILGKTQDLNGTCATLLFINLPVNNVTSRW